MRFEELATKVGCDRGHRTADPGGGSDVRRHAAAGRARGIRTLTLSRTPEAVWRAISDSVRIRAWRRDLIQLEHLPDSASHAVWREIGDDGRGTMVVTREELPPVRLVTDRITEARGPTSEWTYAISRAPSGIDLTHHRARHDPLHLAALHLPVHVRPRGTDRALPHPACHLFRRTARIR
jgi:hypothetical protein